MRETKKLIFTQAEKNILTECENGILAKCENKYHDNERNAHPVMVKKNYFRKSQERQGRRGGPTPPLSEALFLPGIASLTLSVIVYRRMAALAVLADNQFLAVIFEPCDIRPRLGSAKLKQLQGESCALLFKIRPSREKASPCVDVGRNFALADPGQGG
jgi:hypothetical protein